MPAAAPRILADVRYASICIVQLLLEVKHQHIRATTTVLPRGVHVVAADIKLLCCHLRQDTTVDDRKYVES